MEFDLSQAEADALLAIEKHRADDVERDYPAPCSRLSAPLVSTDGRESFLLDVRRSRIAFTKKGTYQHRARRAAILVRLDFGGQPHRNPDGAGIDSPHLHLYREGYGDKWAFPIPNDPFTDLDDLWKTLGDFMSFCNILEQPKIVRGRFV